MKTYEKYLSCVDYIDLESPEDFVHLIFSIQWVKYRTDVLVMGIKTKSGAYLAVKIPKNSKYLADSFDILQQLYPDISQKTAERLKKAQPIPDQALAEIAIRERVAAANHAFIEYPELTIPINTIITIKGDAFATCELLLSGNPPPPSRERIYEEKLRQMGGDPASGNVILDVRDPVTGGVIHPVQYIDFPPPTEA